MSPLRTSTLSRSVDFLITLYRQLAPEFKRSSCHFLLQVTYNFYGSDVDLTAVFSNPGGLGSFVRWRVRLMERAVRQLELGSGEDAPEYVTQVGRAGVDQGTGACLWQTGRGRFSVQRQSRVRGGGGRDAFRGEVGEWRLDPGLTARGVEVPEQALGCKGCTA